MDERERRRLLRALTGLDAPDEPDPAIAISDAIRAAWHKALHESARMAVKRLKEIFAEWGHSEPENDEDLHERFVFITHAVEDAARARMAIAYVIGERPDVTENPRAYRFLAGYEIVVNRKGDLAFQAHCTPAEPVTLTPAKPASA